MTGKEFTKNELCPKFKYVQSALFVARLGETRRDLSQDLWCCCKESN
jgi:hypothetical protein